MPTWLIEGGYRFGIRSADCDEPPHVHITRGRQTAKFWLDPIELAYDGGYNRRRLVIIETLIRAHHLEFMESWIESCDHR
ncbi:MAG: DUF4160 domain-containing protein [Candidatus Limnocylindrales bacterium]